MGYETTLLFVRAHKLNSKKRPVGYCRILATQEMGKIAYNHIGKLMDKIETSDRNKKLIQKMIQKCKEKRDAVFDKKGDYLSKIKVLSKSKREKKADVWLTYLTKLEGIAPFVFHSDHNEEQFVDCYDNPLLIATLDEFREAAVKDQVRYMRDKDYAPLRGFPDFEIAIVMTDLHKKFFPKSNIFVVLWGH